MQNSNFISANLYCLYNIHNTRWPPVQDDCFWVVPKVAVLYRFDCRIFDRLEKCGLFSNFQFGFRSSWSTADLLTVVCDRIARAFNRSGAIPAVVHAICKAFDRVWHAGLLHKLKSNGILGWIFGLNSSFLSNRRLRVVLDWKSSQEYPVDAGVPQRSILGPTLFLLYINDLPDDAISNIAIYADDTTFYSVIRHLICGNNWNWLLNLNLIYESLWTGAEVACWFQCWKNSAGFVWPV